MGKNGISAARLNALAHARSKRNKNKSTRKQLSKSKEHSRWLERQQRKKQNCTKQTPFALKDSKITAAERRHVVESLHAVHGMAKYDFGCYVKNLLKDQDGRSTQRHIDAVRKGQQGLRQVFKRKKKLAPRELLAAQHYLDQAIKLPKFQKIFPLFKKQMNDADVYLHEELIARVPQSENETK